MSEPQSPVDPVASTEVWERMKWVVTQLAALESKSPVSPVVMMDHAQVRDLLHAALALRTAVKEHHDQIADDRCWMDDDKVYAAAGLFPADHRVGDGTEMIKNCARFIARRCEIGGWPSYAELLQLIRDYPGSRSLSGILATDAWMLRREELLRKADAR